MTRNHENKAKSLSASEHMAEHGVQGRGVPRRFVFRICGDIPREKKSGYDDLMRIMEKDGVVEVVKKAISFASGTGLDQAHHALQRQKKSR